MSNTTMNALWGTYEALNGVRDDATRRRAGQAIAGGDYGAGAQALMSGGLINEGIGVQDHNEGRQRQERADQLQIYGQMIGMLQQVYRANGAEGLQQGVQTLMPALLRMPGASPETVQQMAQEVISNPGILDVWGQQIQDEYSYATVGGQRIRTNERTGETDVVYSSPYPVTVDGMTFYPPGMSPQGGQQPRQPRTFTAPPPGARPLPRNPSQPGAGQPRPGSERSQQPRVSFSDHNQARQAIQSLVPGVRFTSGPRTRADQERLRRQGYNPSDTSFHLQARAWDLVPPAGMSMAQLERSMREAGFRVLNEGHHVHVSW